jgi:hypothetical protein
MHLVHCSIFGFSMISAAMASDVQMAVTADGERFGARLVAVDDEQIVFQADDGERRLTTDELVRWSHPASPRARPQVLVSDGSLLVADEDWSGRSSHQLGQETLSVLTASFDSIEIPRQFISALILVPPHDGNELERMIRELRERDGRTDELWLVGGDRVQGTVKSAEGGQWLLESESAELTLPATSVEAAAFDPQLVDRPPASTSTMAVGLRDGSLIHAKTWRSTGDRVELTTATGQLLAAAPLADIVSLQMLQSSQFTYLSALEPADYRHFPYLDLDWPWQGDGNLTGARLESGGHVYLKGIAMHSASRLTYALGGVYRHFVAEIALDDTAGQRGSVIFRVFVAREGQWREALTSGVLRGGDPPQPISVDIAGAQAITLIVDYADQGDELDHANWLDARLVK